MTTTPAAPGSPTSPLDARGRAIQGFFVAVGDAVARWTRLDYQGPDALPPGNVLIVGSGQTGCQLAEELHAAGRKVFLACGRCPWVPRRVGGRDFIWWFNESGFFDRTPGQLASPAARLVGKAHASQPLRRGGSAGPVPRTGLDRRGCRCFGRHAPRRRRRK